LIDRAQAAPRGRQVDRELLDLEQGRAGAQTWIASRQAPSS
jgi:hypothetical protein